jgi:hypothetical protein
MYNKQTTNNEIKMLHVFFLFSIIRGATFEIFEFRRDAEF